MVRPAGVSEIPRLTAVDLPWFTYIARRLLLMFPTLLGITAAGLFRDGVFAGRHRRPVAGQDPGISKARKLIAFANTTKNGTASINPKSFNTARWLNLISPVGFRPTMTVRLEASASNARAWAKACSNIGPSVDLIAETLADHAAVELDQHSHRVRVWHFDGNHLRAVIAAGGTTTTTVSRNWPHGRFRPSGRGSCSLDCWPIANT